MIGLHRHLPAGAAFWLFDAHTLGSGSRRDWRIRPPSQPSSPTNLQHPKGRCCDQAASRLDPDEATLISNEGSSGPALAARSR
jgi:hypothetical protein